MPERIRELRVTLAALGEQLESASEIGEERRIQIRSAMEEIEAALREAEGHGGAPQLSATLRERFSDALQQFEESHPALTAALGRVVRALADLGI